MCGPKRPPSSKKKPKKSKKADSEFDKDASQLYHRLTLRLLEDTVQQKKDRQSLQESTTQEDQKKR